MTTLQTRPLGATLGLEVLDVDLSAIDDATFEALRALWQAHPLLFLRRQALLEDELVGFSRRFGELDILVRDDMFSPTHPEVIYITNLKAESGRALGGLGSYEMNWHTDQIYRQRPPTGSIFYAVEMPVGGPQTWWCDTSAAYEALPDALRTELLGLRATCKYGNRPEDGYQRDVTDDAGRSRIESQTPPATHPMVLTHPVTRRRSLYFDPRKTIGIEGMEPERALALIRELAQHLGRPEFVYRHDWRPGDVVFWDNARLLHRRDGFDAKLPRFAKRTTIHLPPEQFPVPSAQAGQPPGRP